jgi:hypothetical protein
MIATPTPTLRATVERRLLVNYRADPDVVENMLPAPFRPQLVGGSAVVGVCLIRLAHLAPTWAPRGVGLRSESAAHRIAVEWDDADGTHSGVYIPMRHTDSALARLAGGRIFPGVHHTARVEVDEGSDHIDIDLTSRDASLTIGVRTCPQPRLTSRLFADLEVASAFFEAGSIGWSPGRDGQPEGVELSTDAWRVAPMAIDTMSSTFLDDPVRFPADAIELDCALLMKDVEVLWRQVRPPGISSRTSELSMWGGGPSTR